MGLFTVGDVVTVPFPYSDLGQNKKRPALVVASLPGSDSIVCAITSQPYGITNRVQLSQVDFIEGGLRVDPSFALPSKLFTADESIIKKVGRLSPDKTAEVTKSVIENFK
jgi:mRNA interferase MazF